MQDKLTNPLPPLSMMANLDNYQLPKLTKMSNNFSSCLTDQLQTINHISEISGISCSSVLQILTVNLGMEKIAATFVPVSVSINKKVKSCFQGIAGNWSRFSVEIITVIKHGVTVMTWRKTTVEPMEAQALELFQHFCWFKQLMVVQNVLCHQLTCHRF